MKIVFFGTPDFVIPVLESLLKIHDVIAVVTAPDHFVSKKKQFIPSPVKTFYQSYYATHASLNEPHPLQIFTPEKLDETFTKKLALMQPELFVVAAYGKIIAKSILDIPSLGALNVHPSLLPKYRGTSPVQAALLNGDRVAGVSIIKMDEKMDHGPVLASESVEILETDTFETLVKRLFKLSATMLPDVITNYAVGNIPIIPQDETQATYVKIISKDNGYIDLTQPIDKKQLNQMIRAYYPWPGVWTRLQVDTNGQEKLVKFFPEEKVQMEGKNVMSVKDFCNGYPKLKEVIQKLFEE